MFGMLNVISIWRKKKAGVGLRMRAASEMMLDAPSVGCMCVVLACSVGCQGRPFWESDLWVNWTRWIEVMWLTGKRASEETIVLFSLGWEWRNCSKIDRVMLHHPMRECCVCRLHLSTVLKRKHQSLRGLEQQPRGNPSPTALFRNAWL